jgi:hypothetical protein
MKMTFPIGSPIWQLNQMESRVSAANAYPSSWGQGTSAIILKVLSTCLRCPRGFPTSHNILSPCCDPTTLFQRHGPRFYVIQDCYRHWSLEVKLLIISLQSSAASNQSPQNLPHSRRKTVPTRPMAVTFLIILRCLRLRLFSLGTISAPLDLRMELRWIKRFCGLVERICGKNSLSFKWAPNLLSHMKPVTSNRCPLGRPYDRFYFWLQHCIHSR